MNARIAPEGASRNDHIHGDEHLRAELTWTERLQVERRAEEIIAERLQNAGRFHDLMDGLNPDAYEPYWHIAAMNIRNARSGDSIAKTIVENAVMSFLALIESEARLRWQDECEELADGELTK